MKFLRGIKILCKKVQPSTVWSFEDVIEFGHNVSFGQPWKKHFVFTSGYGMDDGMMTKWEKKLTWCEKKTKRPVHRLGSKQQQKSAP